MGMNAEVIAIGPFSKKLVPFLPYPERHVVPTNDNARIAVSVFGYMNGSSSSRALAECLGIEPWTFGQHKFDANRVNMENLRALVGSELVDRFIALSEHNFTFYFRPNG